ncbi:hypothetical protein [Paractinoplanes rishiriensis]|uniref:Uncharacterized protein n=1 Tax=Paractinoplanes rishiriensis TaxID=1050105 RepID=A0A919MTA8_9ACTN|nr:hypothetical protein [Actinoplanes rishiriensis]GIE94553.1 hypothetical protein Ari01nite_20180 [Actinoplanes rishiriensis]
MPHLPEKTLAAIGRMTVAAADLEHLLAGLSADPAATFARPGAALGEAREAVRAASGHQVAAVEAAATQLAVAQSALRRLWLTEAPADSAAFDEITAHLRRCHDWLAQHLRSARNVVLQ